MRNFARIKYVGNSANRVLIGLTRGGACFARGTECNASGRRRAIRTEIVVGSGEEMDLAASDACCEDWLAALP